MRGVSASRELIRRSWFVAFRDAAIVVVVCALVSLGVNGVRPDGIPMVQKSEYQILVPCPETGGEAIALVADTPLLRSPHGLIIDARSSQEFNQWHALGAINIPFDYLEPTPKEAIDRIVSSGAQKVVVYGDGGAPDSGEQLARELSGKGVRNMHFVRGGAPAIMAYNLRGAAP